jgi:MoxR-like ATPase
MTTRKNKTTAKVDVKSAAGNMRAVAEAANTRYFDMEDSITATILALIVGANVVLIGPPGTAKTALLKFIAGCVSDAKVWEAQFSSEMRLADMVGERDILALQKGQLGYIRQNTLVDCDIGVADEVFKAPGQCLNSGLSLFHPEERNYRAQELGKVVKVPLRSVFGASNEFPQGIGGRRSGSVDMGALYDRFGFRVITKIVQNHTKRRAILKMGRDQRQGVVAAPPTITMDEVRALGKAAVAVNFPPGLEELLFDSVDEFRGQGVDVSPRKEEQIANAIQAAALLRSKDPSKARVSLADLRTVLPHMVWNHPEDVSKVSKVVGALGNSSDRSAVTLAERTASNLDQLKRTLSSLTRPEEISKEDLLSRLKPLFSEFTDIKGAWSGMTDSSGPKPLDLESYEQAKAQTDEMMAEARKLFKDFDAKREAIIAKQAADELAF